MINTHNPGDSHKGLMAYQNYPNGSSWILWKKLLQVFCSKDYELRQSLGKWFVTSEDLHRKWQYCYSKQSNQVYINTNTSYDFYQLKVNICKDCGHATTIIHNGAALCDLDFIQPNIILQKHHRSHSLLKIYTRKFCHTYWSITPMEKSSSPQLETSHRYLFYHKITSRRLICF